MPGPGGHPRPSRCSCIPTAVRVEVVDPDDPTPYVYVSTRTPQLLAEAIRGSA
ncbi:DUF3093 family protein [Streptomyces sp. NPDC056227]|uniref:DUF3093 family protein n=1 Tax=unclassified Streptomyces TaxID=2593676 RepID=UPI0035E1F4CF